MAAMSTVLTAFSTNGDSKTYSTSGHTALKPRLVIHKRKVPSGNATIATQDITIIRGTVDALGVVLPSKVSMAVTFRVPVLMAGSATEVADALTILKDIVNGDEFAASLASQNFLKP